MRDLSIFSSGFSQKRLTARLFDEQAFLSDTPFTRLVQSQRKPTVYVVQTCCLRCGRVEGIGHEHIDQCVDCEAMGFHID